MSKEAKTKTQDRVLRDPVRETPVDKAILRTRRRWVVIPLAVLVVLGVVGFAIFTHLSKISVPVDYDSDEMHFKYGSIGSDTLEGNGVPYYLWLAMPQVCGDLLPGGYASLGVVMEPGMDRPIGFSKRRTGFFDSVGLNCASCHTATVREKPGGERRHYLAASSHQLDLWEYFNFLFSCGTSSGFTPERVLPVIESMTELNFVDRFIYRQAIEQTPPKLAAQRELLSWINERPLWGPGRVDTFNPYRSLIFSQPVPEDSVGTADFMTIWNQELRDGIFVHWDGNNPSVMERNLSAALGAGATPDTVDLDRLNRIRDWIWDLQAPQYPFAVDTALAAAGEPLYYQYCAYCHDRGYERFGQVESADYLGVDPYRADAFDPEMTALMNQIGEGKPWRFHQFRTTDGYANHPLDGAWLRAPYLHNGSVPTMADLLSPGVERPAVFYKGNDVYDQQRLGFVSDVPAYDGKEFFRFDTSERGNGNGGHEYGTELSAEEKAALIEYMKTL